jgi:hypothetical protein
MYYNDEKTFVGIALHILGSGDLNPEWFGHPGSFVIYVLAVLYAVVLTVYFVYCFIAGHVNGLSTFKDFVENDPSVVYYCGRLFMVVMALATVYIVYLVGKKHFSKPVGLLGSAILAASPLYIKFSRIIRTDISTTFLVMLSLYFLLRLFEEGRSIKLILLSSLLAGFSIAAKYTSGIIIFPLLIYCIVSDYRRTRLLTKEYLIDFFKLKTDFSRALLFIFVGFFIFAPFVILDYKHAIKDIIFESKGGRLGLERLPGIRTHLWYLKDGLRAGFGGLFFEIFAAIGLLVVLLKRSYKEYLFFLFPVLYFVAIGMGKLKWNRWMIPVLPFEAILFGIGFYSCYFSLMKRHFFQARKILLLMLFAAILIGAFGPLVLSDIKTAIKMSRPSTKKVAREWIEENLPSGSKIADEKKLLQLSIRPKKQFQSMDLKGKFFVSESLDYYKEQFVDYAVILGYVREWYYNEPEKYRTEIERYEELNRTATLIKRVDNQRNAGPVVEIYEL